MRNKVKVLALLVALVTGSLTLATAASAQEQEVDPGTGTKFVLNTLGGLLQGSKEPTITCETNSGSGEFTSKTTATLNWSGSSCHASFFGIVTKCHSSGSESEASIVTNLNMHFITSNNKPAVLVTGTFPTVVCVAFTTINYGGNGVIGTITSPACKTKSKSLTMGFGTSEGKQADRLYTGVEYGLTAETEPEGSAATATFTASLTLSSNSELEMTCQ